MKKVIAALFSLLISAQTGFTQEQNGDWIVAVTRFRGIDLNIEETQHLTGFPLAILQEIESTPGHYLSTKEKSERAQKEREEKIRELERTLTDTKDSRDSMFLFPDDTSREEIRELDRKIISLKEEINLIQQEPLQIKEGEEAIGIMPAEKNRRDELYEYPRLPIDVWSRQEGFDAVISGFIERIDDLLYVEIEAYKAGAEVSTTIYRGTFFSNEWETAVEESSPHVRTLLYGKEWGDVTVEVKPEATDFTVDGMPQVLDKTGRFRYLNPGFHVIQATADGYESEEFEVFVQAGKSTELELSLDIKKQISLLLKSEPAGADIFIDSISIGTTPMFIDGIVPPATIMLRKDNYQEKVQVVNEESAMLNFTLHPADVRIEQIVEKSRDRFYQGLAAFLISLPLTIISYGMSEQYAYAYNSAVTTGTGSMDEIDRLKSQSSMWYTAYLGGIFLNSLLFTDTIIGMSHYIRSSQEY